MPTRDGVKDGSGGGGGGGGGGDGDITAVTVSSGGLLSGGGTSGDINISSRFDNSLTWTGVHTYNPGTAQATPILLGMAQPSSTGQRDSHALQWRGTAYDGAGHNADWRMFADVTANDGSSTFVLQNRKDAASFATAFSVSDAGLVTVAGKITGLTQATAATDAVAGGRALTGGTGINAIGDLTDDRTISVDTTVISTKTYADSTAAAAASSKANSSVTLTAGAGLTGGGNLTANRSFAVNTAADFTWTGNHTFSITDAVTSAISTSLFVNHNTSGTAAAGISSAIEFLTQGDSGQTLSAARIAGGSRSVSGAGSGVLQLQFWNGGSYVTSGWVVAGLVYSTAFGLGSLNSSLATTTNAIFQINNSTVEYKSNSATQGGHSFIGSANSSGSRQFFLITPSANTGSTASTEVKNFEYVAYTHQWATGAIAIQREAVFSAPTYSFVGASVVSQAATLAISGAPIAGTNATITEGLSFWTQNGLVRHDFQDTSAATTVIPLVLAHRTSTTATAGNGVGLEFQPQNAAGASATSGRVFSILTTLTAGSETGTLLFATSTSGAVATTSNNVGWIANGVWGGKAYTIATITATGAVTVNAQMIAASNMVNFQNNAATLGGFLFTGTANTSGSRSYFVITPSSNTGVTLSTAVPGFDWQAHTTQWATGAGPAEQIEFRIAAPTYAAVGASVFPIASTLAITGAPIPGANMTISKALAFHVQAGGSQFDGNVGFYGNAPTGQVASGYSVVNNVTSGGTDGIIADFAASSYATDAATIRNNIFQLAKKVLAIDTWMRAAGPLT